MHYEIADQDSNQALHYNAITAALNGFSVHEGLGVSIETGTLGEGEETLAVDPGGYFADREYHESAETTIDIPEADPDDPRKDLLVGTVEGELAIELGEPGPAFPEEANGTDSRRPAPPWFEVFEMDATPICEIWVDAGEETLEDDDLTDRRVGTNTGLGDAVARSLRLQEFVDFEPIEEPSAPDEEAWRVYRNEENGALKAINEDAETVTIAMVEPGDEAEEEE